MLDQFQDYGLSCNDRISNIEALMTKPRLQNWTCCPNGRRASVKMVFFDYHL